MTEIICILDRSGSMSQMASEVINSFNHFVREQKNLPITSNEDKLTLVLFDDKYEVVYDRIPLPSVPALTPDTYYVRGMTGLNDAIGKAVYSVSHSKTNVIVLIQTDGMENASKEFRSEQIKQLIKEKERLGWEFNFVGAGLDAFNQGTQAYGISIANCLNVSATRGGVQTSFKNFGGQATNYRNQAAGIRSTYF